MTAGVVARPAASSENARRTMQANRRVSRRELELRAAVRRAGLRGYRVASKLPGRPDLAFPGVRLAVFVHGCFWHRCPSCALAVPKANREFWTEKFRRNVERDDRAVAELAALGWDSMVVWEHDIRGDVDAIAAAISERVARRRARRAATTEGDRY